MKISDFNNSVMYVKNEKLYYYIVVDESRDSVYYGSWHEDDLTNKWVTGTKSSQTPWNGFLENSDKAVKYSVKDFPDKCKAIQKFLINSLFKGWLL